MSFLVKLSDIIGPYTNCMRHALFSDESINISQAEFEQYWLVEEGITPIRMKQRGKIFCYLKFHDRPQYIMWLLRWS